MSKIQGAELNDIVIVKDGKPNATIVISAKPAKVEPTIRGTVLFGAELLRDYIERSTGAKLPIKNDSENISGNLILLGKTKIGEKLGLFKKEFAPEEYKIKRFENGVAISGFVASDKEDKGTLYGVYKFLEDIVGVRWYFPTEMGTIVPKHKTLIVSNDYKAEGKPFFQVRIGGISHWTKKVARDWHPVLRYGMSTGKVANHSMESWNKFYGKTHPEYFGLRKDGTRAITTKKVSSGQNQSYMCFSEPGVLKQLLKNVDDYYEKGDKSTWTHKPHGNFIEFGPHDTRKYCLCPKCKSKLTLGDDRWRHGETSDVVFELVQKYAVGVKKKHPEAIICAMAYDHYQLPPLKIKRLPDNVQVTLCLIPTIIQTNHPGVKKEYRKNIEDWAKLVNNRKDRLIIWDYFCYPNCFFLAPTEIPHLLKDDINYLKDKALGIFNNGFNPRTKSKDPRLYLTYRIVWLMHQLLWNPDLDLEKAKNEWCGDLFGPASGKMNEFYTLLEDRWEKTVWKTKPRVGYVGEYSIFFETYPPKVVNKLENLYNSAIEATTPGSIYRKRLEFFKNKAYAPFFAKAREYHMSTGAVSQYKAPEITPISNGGIDQEMWRKLPVMTTLGRVFGKEIPEKNIIKAGYDKKNLYIYGNFEISDKSIIPKGYSKKKASSSDAQAEFQFGAGKKLKPEVAKLLHAKATGAENPDVNSDDMFIIYVKVGNKGYTELAINPNGSFSSKANIIKKRGFFPSDPMIEWSTKNIQVTTECVERRWLTLVSIPWKNIPGLKTTPPSKLGMQFLRWNVKDKHHFSCWSPPLSSWDFPLSRFGNVYFKIPKGKLVTKTTTPTKDQSAYIGAMGKKDEGQPLNTLEVKHGKALIVGHRDLGQSWLEMRGLVYFDLPKNISSDEIYKATLTLQFINVVGDEPFDGVVVKHIIPTDASTTTSPDYSVSGKTVGPLLPPGYKRGKAHPDKPLSIDVTEFVREDLGEERKSSCFRLQSPSGCTENNKKLHYIIFNGKTDSAVAPKLSLQIVEQ